MNLMRWLFRSTNIQREPDAFTAQRTHLWQQIRQAIYFQQQQGNVVWIVAHFADQFSEMQRQLGLWKMEYEMVMRKIEPETLVEMSLQQRQVVFLALAELLIPADKVRSEIVDPITLCMIAIERHPMIDFDVQLERFAHEIPGRVKFGYYLALEDPAFGAISQSVIATLKQLGLKDHQLINSYAATRSIQRFQKKASAEYDSSLRADSAEEWMALQKKNAGK